MAAIKRKALEDTLQRRVRARRDPSEESDYLYNEDENSGPEELLNEREEVAPQSEEHGDEDSDVEDESDEEASDEEDLAPDLVSSISFGALAKAQEGIRRPSKSKNSGSGKDLGDGWEDNEAQERRAGKKLPRELSRSDKHAPMEMSSKKAVSRKREVVQVMKREYRDPRFVPLNRPADRARFDKAYSFLDDYREDEMKAVREEIKKTKDEHAKEDLKRTLLSMESRKKARERKRREEEILAQHRKEEKELVKQGKKPFYLKKSEQKKRVLLDQYSGLKGKQLDRVIERRRKKLAGKEKKKLPFARREVDQ